MFKNPYVLLVLFFIGNMLDWISTYFSLQAGNIESNPFYYGLLQGNIWYFLLWKIVMGFVFIVIMFVIYEKLKFNYTVIQEDFIQRFTRELSDKKFTTIDFYKKYPGFSKRYMLVIFSYNFWFFLIYFFIFVFLYLFIHNFSII